MTRATVVTGGVEYTINSDSPRTTGYVFQAIVLARLVDDLTGAPLTTRATMTADRGGFVSRSAPDGYVGLAAVPTRVFPVLAANQDLPIVTSASGYATRHDVAVIAAPLTYPNAFAATHAQFVMRRLPVSVEVRTFAMNGIGALVAQSGATVEIAGTWPTLDAITAAPDTHDIACATPGLAAPRPLNAAIDLAALAISSEPAPARVLATGCAAGATTLAVSKSGAFVAGDLVALDLAAAERAERIEVTAVRGTVDGPSDIDLRFPTRYDHLAGAAVQRIPQPAPVAATTHLRASAYEGDRTLAVDSAAGLAGTVVRVTGGAAAPEYVALTAYTGLTDAEGFTRLPPINGVAAISLAATSGARSATALVTLTESTAVRSVPMTLH